MVMVDMVEHNHRVAASKLDSLMVVVMLAVVLGFLLVEAAVVSDNETELLVGIPIELAVVLVGVHRIQVGVVVCLQVVPCRGQMNILRL